MEDAFKWCSIFNRFVTRFYFFNFVYVRVCIWVCAPECRCPWRPKALYHPGTGVAGVYELPDMGAGN